MDTESGTKSANLADAQRKLLHIVDDATHKLDSEERRAILDTLFSALYQDKCPIESELKDIMEADVMLVLTLNMSRHFELYYQYDAPISSETIATGSTLTELIENYKARE